MFLDRTGTLVNQDWTWAEAWADLGLRPTLDDLGLRLGPILDQPWPTLGRLWADFWTTFGQQNFGAQGRPQSWPKDGPKSAQSRSKVCPKSSQSRPKVDPKSAQSRPKVGPRSAQASAQGRPKSAKIGPGPILADQSSGPVQKHQIWSEMGRESTVWPETKTK